VLAGEGGVLVAESDGVAGVPSAAAIGHGAAGGHFGVVIGAEVDEGEVVPAAIGTSCRLRSQT
jgi:hypothetical protein